MRVLIVDHEVPIHDHYRRALVLPEGGRFLLTHCRCVHAARKEVERALADGLPFAVAFIDPAASSDGEVVGRIRALDPDLHLVIVSADKGAFRIVAASAGPADKLLYLAKPVASAEVRQAAVALTARWTHDRASVATRAELLAKVVQLEEQAAELAANESRAMHMAMHDALTDAPNRAAFQRALSDRVKRDGLFAAVMIDLDRFKRINDTLGHLTGDALIREICGILLRTAPAGAMVARLGGDEFGILFDTGSAVSATSACERMIAACSTSMTVFGHQVQGGASAGLVVIGGGGDKDPVEVLRRADLALYDAKRAGKGMARLFDDSMDEGVRFRREIEGRLGQAIRGRELSLAYQPIVTRDTLDIVGFEALTRWDGGEFGAISPSIFMSVAEETDMIHELGEWVLGTALAELATWPGHYVSVNFSRRQFHRPGLVDHLRQAVERAGVPPARLQIEITEAAIFDDAIQATETLSRLKALGFRIALDDFGTGYSSLHNIRTFALDSLKIDRSFIDGMGREREAAAIVHSIIHLGRALGLGVIAEGVESEAQVQALRIAGASHLQGFFFSPPVSADRAREMAGRPAPYDSDAADDTATRIR